MINMIDREPMAAWTIVRTISQMDECTLAIKNVSPNWRQTERATCVEWTIDRTDDKPNGW